MIFTQLLTRDEFSAIEDAIIESILSGEPRRCIDCKQGWVITEARSYKIVDVILTCNNAACGSVFYIIGRCGARLTPPSPNSHTLTTGPYR